VFDSVPDLLPLVRSFGVAVVDAALVDAVCRAMRVDIHGALRDDLLGFGTVPLPDRPATSLAVRHTVGLHDPVGAELAEVLERDGVRYLKLKIDADVASGVERIAAIESVVAASGRDCRVVLDGNEQFADLASFAGFVDAVATDPRAAPLLARTLWFEQPTARDAAFADGASAALRTIPHPVVLDESDGSDEVVDAALATGYAGVSAKTCKGLFRTLHAARRLAGGRGTLAFEDLTAPPVHAFHQDTALAAALGAVHIERNAHHFVGPSTHLTAHESDELVRAHPDLWALDDGRPRLRMRDGSIATASLCRGFGSLLRPDRAGLEPIAL
jgi:L-alanine-DL-glutamate epimerase-like enolase superfamily enzyme